MDGRRPQLRWFAHERAPASTSRSRTSREVAAPRPAGADVASGARGRDRPGLDRPAVLPAAGRPRSPASTWTSPGPVHGRPRLRAVGRRRARRSTCGTRCSRPAPVRHPPGRDAGPGRRRVEAGLILIEADFSSVRHAHHRRAGLLAVRDRPRLAGRARQGRLRGQAGPRAEQARGGPPRRLVGLEIDWDGIEAAFAEHGISPALFLGRRNRSRCSRAGARSGRRPAPRGRRPSRSHRPGPGGGGPRRPGSRFDVEWTVEARHERVGATVVELPFFDPPRKRA